MIIINKEFILHSVHVYKKVYSIIKKITNIFNKYMLTYL